tara:strand:+ start:6162 stop:6956 length:795 start_codon:yes stop_codon:yes gene_type:complete
MLLCIDYREKDLIQLFSPEMIEVCNLDVGDIMITDDNKKPRLIFERKTLNDLASSIKDGRYNEQSYRLDNHELENHNIFYIIEGNMSNYQISKGRMDKKTLYSAMFAIQFFKGFSLMKTNTLNDTYLFILHYFQKINKESKKQGYYEKKIEKPIINIQTDENNEKQELIKLTDNNYCDVVKKSKKSFITKENIGEIMISTIPGVSSKSANVIMQKFNTLKNLMEELEKNEKCLDDIKYETSNGTYRKITSTCIDNIKTYLINNM